MLGNKIFFSNISFNCSSCKLGKSKTLLFPSIGQRAAKYFDIIHSDVWGLTPVISHAKYKYFMTFIDDYSKFTWVYFLHSKSKVFSVFKTFYAYIETQFSIRIKVLKSDSVGGICLMNFLIFYLRRELFHKNHVNIHHNKMGFLCVGTNIF